MAVLGRRTRRSSLAFATILSALVGLAASADDNCSNSLSVSYDKPVVADGWSYRLVADNIQRPRGILFDSNGALLVVSSGVGIVHITFEDDGGTCLRVKESKTLVGNNGLNHGIALSQNGETLYASDSDKVYSWSYNASGASVDTGSVRTLVRNMDNSGHSSRTLLLSQKHPEVLIVSRGSAGNDDREAEDIKTGHSQLRAFNLTELTGGDGFDFAVDGALLGWGLRNSVGVAEHPDTGGVWSVENSVDNLKRDGDDVHKDNPGEELNYHGFPNGTADDNIPSRNYGYPYCYTLWATDGFPNRGNLNTGQQFAADRTRGDQATDEKCNQDYTAPVLAFQAHTAPLDLKFDKEGSSAYVSFHGSWNRDAPVGYAVSRISFRNGWPESPSDSRDAAMPIISNPDLSRCPGDCFRPVGLAWDAQGRLWFSSDSTGEVFVLQADDGANSRRNETSGNGGGGKTSGDDSAASQYLPRSGVLGVGIAAVVMGLFLA